MSNTRVPFAITATTISFYARGRQYSIAKSAPEFNDLRAALQRLGDHDIDELIALTDVRQALLHRSQGEIVLDEENDTILYRGQPLHNVWVERILDYRSAGEPFEPVWNALNRLVQNPTPAAIERLPVFLERTALGFLPDGRFLAFKGVDAEFYSCHRSPDGTRFRHLVGDICRMERSQVDPNPNNTCSTGLHVGAPGYVKSYYGGASHQLVLVAVAPEDVVAVPVDYNGEKMRVCGYEVFDHLSQDYNDELLGRLRTTQAHGYGASAEPAPIAAEDPSIYSQVKAGDVIRYNDDNYYGRVIEIDETDPNVRVRIINRLGDQEWITDDEFNALIEPGDVTPAMVAYVGAQILITGHPDLHDGEYVISSVIDDPYEGDQSDGDAETFGIGAHDLPILNGCIQRVIGVFPQPLKAKVGDTVDISNTGGLPNGRYPVIEICPTGIIVQTEYDGKVFVSDAHVDVIWNS